MNIETAKIAENLLYDLRNIEQKLKQLQENNENDNFTIKGTNTIYFSGSEREAVFSLIENYYKEKIKQINNEITAL